MEKVRYFSGELKGKIEFACSNCKQTILSYCHESYGEEFVECTYCNTPHIVQIKLYNPIAKKTKKETQ